MAVCRVGLAGERGEGWLSAMSNMVAMRAAQETMRERGRAATVKRLSARQEDYLETIAELTESHGHAHVRDIAEARRVTMATVSEAVRNLARQGLVHHDSWGTVTLTERGAQKAREVRRRHGILLEFFRDLLGLPAELAEREACTIEHSVAPETLGRIEALVECVKKCRASGGGRCGCLARIRDGEIAAGAAAGADSTPAEAPA